MGGQRFYSFKAPCQVSTLGGARFFALDSNYMAPGSSTGSSRS